MNRHLLGIGLAMVLLGAGKPVPQRHLEPEGSRLLPVFSDYRRTLGPVLDSSVRIFVVTEGTPFPESVIGLKRTPKGWRIFGAQAAVASRPPREHDPVQMIGTDGKLRRTKPGELRLAPPPPRPAAIKTCDAAIDQFLAKRIIDAWDAVLLQTRPGHGPGLMATDGGVSHFGARRKDRMLSGNDASYIAPDSNPAWLGKIAYDLRVVCNKWKSPGGDPWDEMRHALNRINLRSEEWPRGQKPWYAE
jgi:hypothetical protein